MDSMVAGRESAGRNEGENTMPLIFSNPDLEWQRCVTWWYGWQHGTIG